MTRLILVATISTLLVTGCASPTPGSGSTYGSPAQQQRMEQDTSMGGVGGGVNAGQGYKGDGSGLGGGGTGAKF